MPIALHHPLLKTGLLVRKTVVFEGVELGASHPWCAEYREFSVLSRPFRPSYRAIIRIPVMSSVSDLADYSGVEAEDGAVVIGRALPTAQVDSAASSSPPALGTGFEHGDSPSSPAPTMPLPTRVRASRRPVNYREDADEEGEGSPLPSGDEQGGAEVASASADASLSSDRDSAAGDEDDGESEEEDEDRAQPVSFDGLDTVYPAPADFDDVDVLSDDRETLKLVGSASWFDKLAIQLDGVDFAPYIQDGEYLPGQLHIRCFDTWVWQRTFCARMADLAVRPDRLPSSVKEDFASACYQGLDRLFVVDPIDTDLGMDLFVYRNRADFAYVDALASIPQATLESWRNVVGVRQEAICFGQPLLRVDFRYLSKTSDFWLKLTAGERYDRSYWNQAVPFHCPQASLLTRDARRRAFPRLTESWHSDFEVAEGCAVGLPSVFSYKPSALMSRSSGYWVVAYTEQACKAAAFVLWETYDSLRLWWLPSGLIRAMRALDLRCVLGSQTNADELTHLLTLIESTDFARLPPHQSLRYADIPRLRGSRLPGADFAHYNPWTRRLMTQEEYEALRTQGRPQMPGGYPTGYNFDVQLPGWDGRVYNPPLPMVRDNAPSVDFLGPEVERAALPGVFSEPPTYGGTTYTITENDVALKVLASQHDYYESGAPAAIAGVAAQAAAGATGSALVEARSATVRDFLREVGLPESSTSGSWSELVAYMRGRLGM